MRTIFRQYKDGEVIALFPDEPTQPEHPEMCAACLIDGWFMNVDPTEVIKNTKPALKTKYARLKRLLERDKELEIEVDDGKKKMKMMAHGERHVERAHENRIRFRV